MRCVKIDNWSEMAPPYDDYEYFMNHEQYPFAEFDNGFNYVNAWWLAEASALAYSDKEKVAKELKKVGFDKLDVIETKTVDCFIAFNGFVVLVIFRGSELRPRPDGNGFKKVIADWSTNLSFKLVDWESGGQVHSGFKKALDDMWPKFLRILKQYKESSIWFTGHSLGAALATLAADRVGCTAGVYGFGSPRVGDEEYQKRFSVGNFTRIINNTDVVNYLPFFADYFHVGRGLQITDRGLAEHEDKQEKLDVKGIKGALSFNNNPVPQCIYDHIPLHYSTFFWNYINGQIGFDSV